LESLVVECAQSPEFQGRRDQLGLSSAIFPLDRAPPISVQSHPSSTTVDQLWQRIRRSWQEFGETDPYWSVLSDKRWRKEKMSDEAALEAFYATALDDIERFDVWLARNGVVANPDGICAEYGCGVGRVTAGLARRYRVVRAFDISASHLEAACRRMQACGISNVEFFLVREPQHLDALSGIDVFFSMIVLQHNPPPTIRLILERAMNGLNRGGLAYFQVPTYILGYQFDASSYLSHEQKDPVMEMHCLPQRDIFAILHKAGLMVREVQSDGWVGCPDLYLSNTFLAERM
jgi:SAM-dependent methyltransferase